MKDPRKNGEFEDMSLKPDNLDLIEYSVLVATHIADKAALERLRVFLDSVSPAQQKELNGVFPRVFCEWSCAEDAALESDVKRFFRSRKDTGKSLFV